jgi:hypothetical protein
LTPRAPPNPHPLVVYAAMPMIAAKKLANRRLANLHPLMYMQLLEPVEQFLQHFLTQK